MGATYLQLKFSRISPQNRLATAFFAPKTVNFGGGRGRRETYRNLKVKCKSEVFQKWKEKFKRISNFL